MTRIVKVKPKVPSEDFEQARLSTWLDRQNIRFFAIPNGGSRNPIEGAKFKRCGVKSGVPDLCMPIPSGPYHGLYIEMKRKQGGTVSPTQKEWIVYLRSVGYFADVAFGFEHAKEIINNYLSLLPPAA